MFKATAQYFESPDDKDPTFISLVRNILIFTIVATLASIAVIVTTSNTPGLFATLSSLAATTMLEALALYFALRNNVLPAKVIVPVALVLAITIIAFSANSVHDTSIIAYPLIMIIAALLQGNRSLSVTLPLALVGFIFLGVSDMAGLSRSPMASRTGIDDLIIGTVLLSTGAGILNLLVGRLRSAISTAEENEQKQLETNKELIQLQASLEEQIQERTMELANRGSDLETALQQIQRRATQFEALAQVAQSITSIRDLQELLPRIATVISKNFGFYHVGVFLLDEVNEYAVLVATNSDGGRKMLERKHRLKVGEQGIVGNVTATGEPRIALDVGADAVFFNNPDLPDTHSEMALPLKSGERIVGALDAQSMAAGAFTTEDIQTLSLLADQVSLAIENARLFDESRRALAESQLISRQTTRQAWNRLPEQQNLVGYRYDITGAVPLKEPIEITGTDTSKSNGKQSEAGSYVVPIGLRGEVIGTLMIQSPSGDQWSEDQRDLIKAVAERVALAAENARLFDETTQRAERERLVSDITSKIRSHNDPQAMIETAISELRTALGASRVEIVPQSVKNNANQE